MHLARAIKTSLQMVLLLLLMPGAAVKAAFLNVRINLSGIKDEAFVTDITTK